MAANLFHYVPGGASANVQEFRVLIYANVADNAITASDITVYIKFHCLYGKRNIFDCTFDCEFYGKQLILIFHALTFT